MTPTTRAGLTMRDALRLLDSVTGMDERAPVDWAHGIREVEAEARQQERERLAGLVEAMKSPMSLHTCWDNHDESPIGSPHADGTACPDRPTTYLDRAAVLSILRETEA